MSSAMNAAEPDSANVVNTVEPDSASASEPVPAPKPALKRKEMAVESSSFIKALFPIVSSCLLSGCVNTISTSYQVHLAQSIGVTNFQAILNHKTLPPAHNSVAPCVSPPHPNHEFPGATFFTPKQPTNKKSQE